MRLLVDCGNTRIKWAWVDADDRIQARGAALTSQPYALAQALQAGPVVGAAWVASVAGAEIDARIAEVISSSAGTTPRFLRAMDACDGLLNGYREPVRLGVDRWLVMLGAHRHYPGPCLVVSLGTAVTIDAIAKAGAHLGGYIVPGIGMQRDALFRGTAGVRGEGTRDSGGWGRSTAEAVAYGLRLEVAALVEKCHVELAAGVDDTCRLLLTGGDATEIAPLLPSAVVDQELLFKGMLVQAGSAPRPGAVE